MAAVTDLPEAILKVVECSVCMMFFNISDREPQSLRCGHSFCRLCIQRLSQQNSINCPKCRDRSWINQIRKNFSVVDMLETLCVECIVRTRSKTCGHCQKGLCTHCIEIHAAQYFSAVKSDLHQLEESISVAFEISEQDQHREEELEHLQNTLSAIRLDVQSAQDAIAAYGKELEEKVDAFHKENLDTTDQWKNDLKETLLQCKGFVTDAQINISAPIKDKFPEVNVEKLQEKCQTMKHDIANIVSSTPKMKQYRYFSHREAKFKGQMLGMVETELTTEKKENISPSTNVERQSPQLCATRYAYDSVTFLFTRGAFGDSHRQFDRPEGITVAENGWIIVVDSNNDRIKTFDTNFEVISIFGDVGIRYDEFRSPLGVCISPSNEVYIADQSNSRIQVYSTYGTFLRTFGRFGPDGKIVKKPTSIAFGKNGLVYVIDNDDNLIKLFRSDGTFVKSIAHVNKDFYRLEVTHDLKILVTLRQEFSKCHVYDSDGNFQRSFPEHRAVNYSCLTIDPYGYILLYNMLKRVVEVFKNPDEYVCCFRLDAVKYCSDMAVDRNGRIIITDNEAHKLKVYSVPRAN